MNRTVLISAACALGGALVAATATGFVMDQDPIEIVRCNVNDQEIADYQRAVEIGGEVEKLQDMKMRLLSENSTLKLAIDSNRTILKEQKLAMDLQEARMSSAKILADETGKQVRAAGVKKSAFDR